MKFSMKNINSFKLLIVLSMFYFCIMICNAILTHRYIGTDKLFVLGGSFTSPLIFILGDIIAEIYGYKIIKFIIYFSFLLLTLFCFICEVAVSAPYPSILKHHDFYFYILGPSLLWIDITGFISYMLANLTNSYLLTKWKVLLKGKKFWLRSFCSSTLSEALYSVLAILMMEFNKVTEINIMKIILLSYLIKLIYSVIFLIPSCWFVNLMKEYADLDIYELPSDFLFTKISKNHVRR